MSKLTPQRASAGARKAFRFASILFGATLLASVAGWQVLQSVPTTAQTAQTAQTVQAARTGRTGDAITALALQPASARSGPGGVPDAAAALASQPDPLIEAEAATTF